jgi:hypothetical protein
MVFVGSVEGISKVGFVYKIKEAISHILELGLV